MLRLPHRKIICAFTYTCNIKCCARLICCMTLINLSNTYTHMFNQSGLLSVWSIDSQGQLHPAPIHQHRLHSPVTHCAMLHPYTDTNTTSSGSVLDSFSWQKKSAAHLAQSVQDPIACFIATEDGKKISIMLFTLQSLFR